MENKNEKPSIKDSFISFVSDYTRFQIVAALAFLVVIVLAVIFKKLFF